MSSDESVVAIIFKWAGSAISSSGGQPLVPTPRAPPGEKRSGEQSQIFWAYSCSPGNQIRAL